MVIPTRSQKSEINKRLIVYKNSNFVFILKTDEIKCCKLLTLKVLDIVISIDYLFTRN